MLIHTDLKQFSNLSDKFYQSLSYPSISMIVALKMPDFDSTKLDIFRHCLIASRYCRQACLIQDSLLLVFLSSPITCPQFPEKSVHVCLDEFISGVSTQDVKCHQFIKTGKLGISILTMDADTIKSAIIHASQATLRDNTQKIIFFDATIGHKIRRYHQLEQCVNDTIEHQNIDIVYQPIINSKTWEIAGYEALSRFDIDESLESNTQELIHVAERLNKIADLNLIAYQQAFKEMTSYIVEHELYLTINFSSRLSPEIPAIFDCLMVQLEQQNFPANQLIVDINPTYDQSVEAYDPVLPKFHKQGINFCLDDLSMGFALSRQLAKKRYQFFKISRASVRNFHKDNHFYEVIKLLVRICQNYKVSLMAEGVETVEEARLLSFIGVDYMQGYLFSRPCPAVDLENQTLTVQNQIEKVLEYSSTEDDNLEIMRIARANLPRLDPGDTLSLAYTYFRDLDITVLPVIVEHTCVGILDKDTLQLYLTPGMGTKRETANEAKQWHKKVNLMMNPNFTKVDISTTLKEILYLYEKKSLSFPLVVSQGKRFKGIVTKTLLLNYLITQQKIK